MSRSKIHLCLDTESSLDSFKGTDGKKYARIWEIRRVLSSVGRGTMLCATLNDEKRIIDDTCPTFVTVLPKDAKEIPHKRAEYLHKSDTHYWEGYMYTESDLEVDNDSDKVSG